MGEKETPPSLTEPFKWAEFQIKKQWHHIRAAGVACICILVLGGAVGYFLSEKENKTATEAKNATIETLSTGIKERDARIERLEKDLAKSKDSIHNSFQQILNYIKDPNAEKLLPDATNRAAVAYGGDGSMSFWDTNSQKWYFIIK